MSTCSCTQPSTGFGQDENAPFRFHNSTIFALLDYSITSSPIYKSNGGNNTSSPLCNTNGASVCSLLYSCQAVSRLNIPISTCCVYASMDLQTLQCSSYSGVYRFDGKNSNPQSWNYGVVLKYKFNFHNAMCENYERSNGVCGYSGPYNSFVCNCPAGINTTTECFYAGIWNGGLLLPPLQNGTWLICRFALLLALL